MIHANLSERAMYRQIPWLREALDYLAATDFLTLPSGKIDGPGGCFRVIVDRYTSKLPEVAIWESHRAWIDVQYVATGTEAFAYQPLHDGVRISTPYDADRDVALYEPCGERVRLAAGQFAVFFPHDIHAPGLADGAPAEVLKVVLKIPMTAVS